MRPCAEISHTFTLPKVICPQNDQLVLAGKSFKLSKMSAILMENPFEWGGKGKTNGTSLLNAVVKMWLKVFFFNQEVNCNQAH